MIIAIYARKSIYSDKSDSTQAQYNIALDYCRNHYTDYEILRYEDEGYTGANTDRPSFNLLVNDICDKKIDVLVCYKIDRLSRDVKDFSNFFSMLQKHNVEFVSIKEQIDTSTPLGRAMMYICSVFAQMERETIAERVKDSMIELSKTGKWAGGRAPLGYKRKRITISGKSHTILVEDKETSKILNYISDTFLQCNYSLNGLETYFKKIGFKTVAGKYFSSTQIWNILCNPTYCTADQAAYDYFESLGCIMAVDKNRFDGTHAVMSYARTSGGKKKTHVSNPPEKWIISVGQHKPLWSSEKFIAIQNRFNNNRIDKTRKYKIGILKGIVKCSCGWMMRVKHKVDKTYNKVYDHYFCPNRARRGIEFCDCKFVSVASIDDSVINILKQIKLDKNMIDNYSSTEKENNISLHYRSRSDVQQHIYSLESKISNLTNTLGTNSESSAAKYIISEIEKIDCELSRLRYELLEISSKEKKQKQIVHDKESKYNMICNIVDNLGNADYDELNSTLKCLFKECIWDGTTLHIKL